MGHWSTMCTIYMDTTLQWPAGKLLAISILTGAPLRLAGAPLDILCFDLQPINSLVQVLTQESGETLFACQLL